MDNISIAVSFIVAMLGVAYPILLQVITRLDEKYSSQTILELFQKEWENKVFISSLKVSLVMVFIWMLHLPPLVEIERLNYLIQNSAILLLVISTATLVISFFYFVRKVIIYYTPTQFLPFLTKRHNKNPEQNDYEVFRAITDVLYFSIKNQNEKISWSISNFMFDAFKQIRDKSQNTAVIYPFPYYELVNKTIEELAFQKNKRLIFLEHRTAGSVWLLGQFEKTMISEHTYDWIWQNFLIAIKYQKDEYINFHWETAYQHFRQSLSVIHPNHSSTSFEIVNQKEIDDRTKDRKKFLEFHYALGGLLLYTKGYKSIKRAFTYTQSIPPQYVLLPDTMDEVFNWYFYFLDPYEMNHPWISSRYGFPDLGGMNSSSVIKYWICLYTALLIIRQYSLRPHFVYEKPLCPPDIPSAQSEKRKWIENLDYFKTLVEETLNNKELLSTLELDYVTDEWCRKQSYLHPVKVIELTKQKVIDSYENTLVSQSVSISKVQAFRDSTVAILKPIFEEYGVISNPSTLTGTLNSRYITGDSQIIDKSAFADDQDTTHLNFDSFLPGGFADKYREAISEIFTLAASKTYLLNAEEIIPAFKLLGINADHYIIVSFGLDIKSRLKEEQMGALKAYKIIDYAYSNYHLVGDSLFILKKCDLPLFTYKELNRDEIDKFHLHETLEENHLYTTVIDLNENDELRQSLEKRFNGKDLRKSVYMGIFIKHEVQWKNEMQCIQIRQASVYREQGIINSLNDVIPIS